MDVQAEAVAQPMLIKLAETGVDDDRAASASTSRQIRPGRIASIPRN